MSIVDYFGRAIKRLRSLGLVNTSVYSWHVARMASVSAYTDIRYLRRLARDRYDQEAPGVRPTMHTGYEVLNSLFDRVHVASHDVLVDVGCGEGRVIAGWLSRGLRNPMFGIEINKRPALLAKSSLRRWRNVTILEGDATEVVPATGTLFYLFNTLPREPLAKLERIAHAVPGSRVLIYNFMEPDLAPFLARCWAREDFVDNTHWRQYRAVLFTNLDR